MRGAAQPGPVRIGRHAPGTYERDPGRGRGPAVEGRNGVAASGSPGSAQVGKPGRRPARNWSRYWVSFSGVRLASGLKRDRFSAAIREKMICAAVFNRPASLWMELGERRVARPDQALRPTCGRRCAAHPPARQWGTVQPQDGGNSHGDTEAQRRRTTDLRASVRHPGSQIQKRAQTTFPFGSFRPASFRHPRNNGHLTASQRLVRCRQKTRYRTTSP